MAQDPPEVPEAERMAGTAVVVLIFRVEVPRKPRAAQAEQGVTLPALPAALASAVMVAAPEAILPPAVAAAVVGMAVGAVIMVAVLAVAAAPVG
jgi:hypothetical protein